jgi:hypothetical protein
VIGPDERFRTSVRFVNASESELGTVFLSMGLDGSFDLRIGGAKHAGLGRARFIPRSATLRRGGYTTPRATRLDEQATRTLVTDCLGKRILAAKAEGVLDVLRHALGRGA